MVAWTTPGLHKHVTPSQLPDRWGAYAVWGVCWGGDCTGNSSAVVWTARSSGTGAAEALALALRAREAARWEDEDDDKDFWPRRGGLNTEPLPVLQKANAFTWMTEGTIQTSFFTSKW